MPRVDAKTRIEIASSEQKVSNRYGIGGGVANFEMLKATVKKELKWSEFKIATATGDQMRAALDDRKIS